MARGKKCKDHKGREFSSTVEMCTYWEVSEELFRARKRAGYSLEQALTKPLDERGRRSETQCYDHEGNQFRSKAERGVAWGKSWRVVDRLLTKGYTLEQALTGDFGIRDFLGNKFQTYTDVSNYWGLLPSTLYSRLQKSADKTLTATMLRNRKLTVPETSLENLNAILETSSRKELDPQVEVTEKFVKIGQTERPRFLLGDVISIQQYSRNGMEFIVVRGFDFAELYAIHGRRIHVCFTSCDRQEIAS